MIQCIGLIALLAGHSACDETAPTAANIEEGYRNLSDQNLSKSLADFSTEDQIPPILLGMIKTTGQISDERCEKNQNDIGYICLYNFTPINGSGVVPDTIPDIKARVWQADAGWMVHEIPSD